MKVTMTTDKKYDEVNRLMVITDEEYWESYPKEQEVVEEPIVIEEEPIPDNDEEQEEGQTDDTDID